MADDLRFAEGLPNHPKTEKLVRRCGEAAFRCLLRLWSHASSCRVDGDLSGMDDDDIAIAAGWTGATAKFVGALVDLRWLDGESGAYHLHDWAEHQPYVVRRPERQKSARRAALIKHHGADAAPGDGVRTAADFRAERSQNPCAAHAETPKNPAYPSRPVPSRPVSSSPPNPPREGGDGSEHENRSTRTRRNREPSAVRLAREFGVTPSGGAE